MKTLELQINCMNLLAQLNFWFSPIWLINTLPSLITGNYHYLLHLENTSHVCLEVRDLFFLSFLWILFCICSKIQKKKKNFILCSISQLLLIYKLLSIHNFSILLPYADQKGSRHILKIYCIGIKFIEMFKHCSYFEMITELLYLVSLSKHGVFWVS